ncbi:MULTISPECIES: hypothetical protein [Sphingomonas]|uniref:hypothetical protein n=1 Tax=Sphingomonas TaxID=13687 RepID=UPI00082B1501|nr:hypothetical protein [Sphingomonas sp. CCH10-B3]
MPSLAQAGWIALALLFAVPLIGFGWFFVHEDSARRHLGGITPYLVYILPLYCTVIGAIGVAMNDPHTAMTGFAVAVFTLFPAASAWRKRGRS